MVVPPRPEPHLIMVQPPFLFTLSETALNRPAHATEPHERVQRRVRRSVTQIVRERGRLGRVLYHRPAQQHPPLLRGQAGAPRDGPYGSKVSHQRPFAPFQDAVALPRGGGELRRDGVDAPFGRTLRMEAHPPGRRPFARGPLRRNPRLRTRTGLAGPRVGQRPDLRGAGDLGQIREIERVQARQERRIIAEALVAGQPAGA